MSAEPIIVVPYDEAWPSLYQEKLARIERAIGPWVEEIKHVGSTAVPGLAAKPVIDIMVGGGENYTLTWPGHKSTTAW